MKIAIVNGPNMNLIGVRETQFYGKVTWKEIEERLQGLAKQWKVELVCFQSNHEGELVDFIHEHLLILDGIVLNPAGFSKTGYSILDAMTSVGIPYIEVHMSNIFERGGWHAQSIFLDNAVGLVVGMQGHSYDLGLQGMIQYLVSHAED